MLLHLRRGRGSGRSARRRSNGRLTFLTERSPRTGESNGYVPPDRPICRPDNLVSLPAGWPAWPNRWKPLALALRMLGRAPGPSWTGDDNPASGAVVCRAPPETQDNRFYRCNRYHWTSTHERICINRLIIEHLVELGDGWQRFYWKLQRFRVLGLRVVLASPYPQ